MEKNCVFCQIVAGEKEADIVYQDESLVVFRDIRPYAPVHLLIVPRKHIRSINDLVDEDKEIVAAMIMRAREVAKQVSVNRSGYKLVFNVEKGAGQVVFHLHLHLIGGWQR
ncbi:MAG: HIT-like protein [Syntrophorhabdaceae bacterium PtaU1.Bin034]|jgi:histidine triad (HIT) family protein|nr:MAG: HIT-like protein [Syntrophorhabdaceae bacterium PtaU1.Bin034]